MSCKDCFTVEWGMYRYDTGLYPRNLAGPFRIRYPMGNMPFTSSSLDLDENINCSHKARLVFQNDIPASWATVTHTISQMKMQKDISNKRHIYFGLGEISGEYQTRRCNEIMHEKYRPDSNNASRSYESIANILVASCSLRRKSRRSMADNSGNLCFSAGDNDDSWS